MATQSDSLRNLRIASPCHVDWDHMTGDDRVRFCDSCSLHVYNFSEMSSAEINSLILKTEGRLCGRIYRRADGTLITRDCPVGLRAIRRKISRAASAVFATLLSACSFVFAQEPKKDKSCKEIPALTIERKKADQSHSPAFGGTVLDPLGAVVPGATVSLFDSAEKKIRETTTNENGAFSFVEVPEGKYSLKVTVPGFQKLTVEQVEFKSDEVATARLVLNLDTTTTFLMGVVATSPTIERNGTTVIPRSLIRKLPINE